jgi:hypothetical protein
LKEDDDDGDDDDDDDDDDSVLKGIIWSRICKCELDLIGLECPVAGGVCLMMLNRVG